MPLGQEARGPDTDTPREIRFVDHPRRSRVGTSDSQFVDTPGEGQP